MLTVVKPFFRNSQVDDANTAVAHIKRGQHSVVFVLWVRDFIDMAVLDSSVLCIAGGNARFIVARECFTPSHLGPFFVSKIQIGGSFARFVGTILHHCCFNVLERSIIVLAFRNGNRGKSLSIVSKTKLFDPEIVFPVPFARHRELAIPTVVGSQNYVAHELVLNNADAGFGISYIALRKHTDNRRQTMNVVRTVKPNLRDRNIGFRAADT